MAELAADDPHWIGGYRLLGRLGAGGMGRVYLARSEGGRTVAVKLIKAELAAEREFRTRFRQEVEAARRVGQRWTAPVLDADTEADVPWVATGYIAGPSLDQVVSGSVRGGRGPLPPESLRTLAYGLAGALLDIHGAGLIHRDLKPSNILVTIDGPRVIDFGIARAVDSLPESTVTGAGVLVGSPSYMSPEQVRAGRLGPESDVFCMGAVLAYAATGRPPFGGGTAGDVHAVMFRIAAEEPDLTGLTEPLRGLVADCLAKDPAARPTPEEVVERVQPVTTGTSSAPWLPAPLLAELGRNAVQLLDTDTPPSGSGPPGPVPPHPPVPDRAAASAAAPEPAAPPAPEPVTAVQSPHPAATPAPGTDPGAGATGPGRAGGRRRSRLRRSLTALAALVLAGGAAAVASGADLPLLGNSSSSGGGGAEPGGSSDIPAAYVGSWLGTVERDGEPTGQYRRFDISEGRVGEVVANSISLGRAYECKSDGKLVSASGGGLRLDTKVVKSVPDGTCAALGSHRLSEGADGTLVWEAAGRTAVLHKADGSGDGGGSRADTAPRELLGTWQRPLANGGTQRMTVSRQPTGAAAVRMVSDGGGEHCEAGADLFSAGGTPPGEPARLAPPAVQRAKSAGACVTGGSSALRREGAQLVREFADGTSLAYTRVR